MGHALRGRTLDAGISWPTLVNGHDDDVWLSAIKDGELVALDAQDGRKILKVQAQPRGPTSAADDWRWVRGCWVYRNLEQIIACDAATGAKLFEIDTERRTFPLVHKGITIEGAPQALFFFVNDDDPGLTALRMLDIERGTMVSCGTVPRAGVSLLHHDAALMMVRCGSRVLSIDPDTGERFAEAVLDTDVLGDNLVGPFRIGEQWWVAGHIAHRSGRTTALTEVDPLTGECGYSCLLGAVLERLHLNAGRLFGIVAHPSARKGDLAVWAPDTGLHLQRFGADLRPTWPSGGGSGRVAVGGAERFAVWDGASWRLGRLPGRCVDTTFAGSALSLVMGERVLTVDIGDLAQLEHERFSLGIQDAQGSTVLKPDWDDSAVEVPVFERGRAHEALSMVGVAVPPLLERLMQSYDRQAVFRDLFGVFGLHVLEAYKSGKLPVEPPFYPLFVDDEEVVYGLLAHPNTPEGPIPVVSYSPGRERLSWHGASFDEFFSVLVGRARMLEPSSVAVCLDVLGLPREWGHGQVSLAPAWFHRLGLALDAA